MKELLLFMMPSCPYCKEAIAWQEQLMEEHPAYRELSIRMVDETKERSFADTFDYYYVPSYYLDGEKLHEGAATKEKIEAVLKTALS